MQLGLLDSFRRLAGFRCVKFTTEQIFWLMFDYFESIQIVLLNSLSWCSLEYGSVNMQSQVNLSRSVCLESMIDDTDLCWWFGDYCFWFALLFLLTLSIIHWHTKRRMMLARRTKMHFIVILRAQYGSSASFWDLLQLFRFFSVLCFWCCPPLRITHFCINSNR